MAQEAVVMVEADVYDSLPVLPSDPPRWHRREVHWEHGPIYGSSPAEREAFLFDMLDSRAQGMRDHAFEGGGEYCEARIGFGPQGSPETGTITGWHGCGYPHDAHPIPESS